VTGASRFTGTSRIAAVVDGAGGSVANGVRALKSK
jgi:hypothetical protein